MASGADGLQIVLRREQRRVSQFYPPFDFVTIQVTIRGMMLVLCVAYHVE